MAIRIDESFEVQASPEQVWGFLIDPARVVECLSGAELLVTEDERTFTGRIRVKVGPVVAAYRGRVRFDEMDRAAFRVRMSGEGQETTGGGAAKLRMTSTVSPLPHGGARVDVESEVDVVGRVVQFGRGMIDEVSRQLFRQFAECVRTRIEATAAAPPAAAPVGMPAAEPAVPPTAPAPLRLLPLLWSAIRKRIGWLLRRGP